MAGACGGSKKSGFTVKVIVYLRRQDEFLSSWWNQLIKMRRPVPGRHYETMTWEEYRGNVPDSMQLDYYGALERISAVIGKENVIVRRFDKKYFYGGTIQADFLHCLGLEMTEEFRILPGKRKYAFVRKYAGDKKNSEHYAGDECQRKLVFLAGVVVLFRYIGEGI